MKLRLKPLTEAEEQELERSWQEIGEALAEAIVDYGKTRRWAWGMISSLGIYKHWMLDHWVARYQAQVGTGDPELENEIMLKAATDQVKAVSMSKTPLD